MHLLSKLHRLAKVLIGLDFLISISGEVLTCLLCLLGMIIAVFTADYSHTLELAGRLLAGVGLLAFIAWVAHDIKKHAGRLGKASEPPGREPYREHREAE